MLIGQAGRNYRIKFLHDLSSWTKLADVANRTGTLRIVDPEAGQYSRRSYRAVRQ